MTHTIQLLLISHAISNFNHITLFIFSTFNGTLHIKIQQEFSQPISRFAFCFKKNGTNI